MAVANQYICQLPGKTDRVEITAIDWRQQYQKKTERGRIVGMWDNVAVLQTGKKTFTVCYGLEIHRSLSYTEAGERLGLCLMHACACEGRIDE